MHFQSPLAGRQARGGAEEGVRLRVGVPGFSPISDRRERGTVIRGHNAVSWKYHGSRGAARGEVRAPNRLRRGLGGCRDGGERDAGQRPEPHGDEHSLRAGRRPGRSTRRRRILEELLAATPFGTSGVAEARIGTSTADSHPHPGAQGAARPRRAEIPVRRGPARRRPAARGIRQVPATLPAGLQAFSVRDSLHGARGFGRVVEIDHAVDAGRRSVSRIAMAGLAMPENAQFALIDFERIRSATLFLIGMRRRGMLLFFAWLGVTIYLAREAAIRRDVSLRWLVSPGSEIVLNGPRRRGIVLRRSPLSSSPSASRASAASSLRHGGVAQKRGVLHGRVPRALAGRGAGTSGTARPISRHPAQHRHHRCCRPAVYDISRLGSGHRLKRLVDTPAAFAVSYAWARHTCS